MQKGIYFPVTIHRVLNFLSSVEGSKRGVIAKALLNIDSQRIKELYNELEWFFGKRGHGYMINIDIGDDAIRKIKDLSRELRTKESYIVALALLLYAKDKFNIDVEKWLKNCPYAHVDIIYCTKRKEPVTPKDCGKCFECIPKTEKYKIRRS